MKTNIDIDSTLLEEAHKLSELKTNKEIVNTALEMYVNYLRRQQMLKLRGKVTWEGNLDEMRES
jgi:Arc/MetJ family transcription regulator